MTYVAPARRRVRDSSYKPPHRSKNKKKPHKGLVRLFLVLILVLIAGRFTIDRYHDSALFNEKKKSMVDSLKVALKKKSGMQNKKTTLIPTPLLTYETVKLCIADAPPTLTQPVDTVNWKGVTYIRYMSIDTALQNRGYGYFERYTPEYAGAIVLQPKTGRVLALISYTNPHADSISDKLYGSAYFPAASVAKTVTAAAVIEKRGFTPDSEISISGNPYTLYKAQLVPHQRSVRDITFREAFAKSINPAFARLGIYQAGGNALYSTAKKFGFNEPIPFELPIETSTFELAKDTFALAEIASGYNQRTTMSPMLGALIAGAMSNNGTMVRPTLVDSVVALRDHRTVYRATATIWKTATQPMSARAIYDMMQATAKTGSARSSMTNIKNSARFADFTYGGKTGNVNKDDLGRVEWYVGFMKNTKDHTQHLATGIFMVQGQIWHVRSSYLASELLRLWMIDEEKRQNEIANALAQQEKEQTIHE